MCCCCCRRKRDTVQIVPEAPKYIIDAMNKSKRPPSKTSTLEDLVDSYIRVASRFNKRNIYHFTPKLNDKFNYLMYLEMKLKSFEPVTRYQKRLYSEYQEESDKIDRYVFPNGVHPRVKEEVAPVLYNFAKSSAPVAIVPEEKDFRQINKEDYTGLMIETVETS